jgi:hypothetical protein
MPSVSLPPTPYSRWPTPLCSPVTPRPRSLLSRGVAYAWRIELRQLELLARLDPSRAEELRDIARRRGSTKYEALALAHLGRPTQAAAVAVQTGSDWLLAAVATPDEAGQAVVRLAQRLPTELRAEFLAQGPLTHRRR